MDPIGLAKAILWEEAKGKLRAMASVGGQTPATMNPVRSPDWQKVERRIEAFILSFEDDGLHE